MRVAVVGSRGFTDYSHMCTVLNQLLDVDGNHVVVSGGAQGADKLAERYAKEKGYEMVIFAADWSKYGNSAGIRRNADIVRDADIVVAFWDGRSAGTKNSISLAKRSGKKVLIERYSD